MDEFDAAEAYLIQLNGGAPVNDWLETKEWAQSLLRPKGDTLPKTKETER